MVIVGISITFQNQIVKQLNNWSLLPREQSTTELYFNAPESLPTTYIPNKAIRPGFRIVNTSEQAQSYNYVISQANDASSQMTQLSKGSVMLGAHESKSIEQTIKLNDEGKRTQVVVSLEGLPQKINFWLTK